jgi:hypothetical protein
VEVDFAPLATAIIHIRKWDYCRVCTIDCDPLTDCSNIPFFLLPTTSPMWTDFSSLHDVTVTLFSGHCMVGRARNKPNSSVEYTLLFPLYPAIMLFELYPANKFILRATSHYGRPSREAVGLSGQTLSRVQRNGLKIHSQKKYSKWSLRPSIMQSL